MKLIHQWGGQAILCLLLITACKRNAEPAISGDNAFAKNSYEIETGTDANSRTCNAPCRSNAYEIRLESRSWKDAYWEWTWSVRNPNPGNGFGNTLQDLSHWGMRFDTAFNFSSIMDASYSYNGVDWTSFTPEYKRDPSQSCVTLPVLKFPAGTRGGEKTYYRLAIQDDYEENVFAAGYYRSGWRTGCCATSFTGVGRLVPFDAAQWCALGEVHWYRSNIPWCGQVQFGNNQYTQAQAMAIYNGAPVNSMARQAFISASCLQLSRQCENFGAEVPPSIYNKYMDLVNFLSALSYDQIMQGNYPAGSFPVIVSAVNSVNTWIPMHECYR